jgi:hypothetical protein
MPFYEITFETGRSSVAFYADEAEALSACGEQHRRATAGEPGGPLGVPAERVKKIREYVDHPNDFNPDQTMSAEVLTKEAASLIKALSDENGVVDIARFSVEVRAIAHPMVQSKADSFDSNFKMKETRELKFSFDGAK